MDINVYARFDEFPSLPFQEFKDYIKRHGRMDKWTDGLTMLKLNTPNKHSFRQYKTQELQNM